MSFAEAVTRNKKQEIGAVMTRLRLKFELIKSSRSDTSSSAKIAPLPITPPLYTFSPTTFLPLPALHSKQWHPPSAPIVESTAPSFSAPRTTKNCAKTAFSASSKPKSITPSPRTISLREANASPSAPPVAKTVPSSPPSSKRSTNATITALNLCYSVLMRGLKGTGMIRWRR